MKGDECVEVAAKKRGGARKGAGRKKSIYKRHDPPHRARKELSSKHPVHVTLRTCTDVPRLRQGRAYKATRRVLQRYLGREDFRVVHLSIQHNHFHFLVEALNKRALTRGMQSLAISLANAINRELGREGKVFEHRYHDRQITTPRQARNALAYVLNNWRRHREDLQSPRGMAAFLDPYASGLSFFGWVGDGFDGSPRFLIPPGYEPLPVSPPTTSLLRSDWTQFGPIDLFEKPGTHDDELLEVKLRALAPSVTELRLINSWKGAPLSTEELEKLEAGWSEWLDLLITGVEPTRTEES